MVGTVVYGQGPRPGLAAEIVRLHAVYYAREWGLGADFETMVARGLDAFLPRSEAGNSRIFHATLDGRLAGSLTLDGGEPDTPAGACHLRWFILSDEARGRGIGGTLMESAVAFLDTRGIGLCWLTTFAGLDAARSLYERHDFQLASTQRATTWGRELEEQRFERRLL